MKAFRFLLLLLITQYSISCRIKKDAGMDQEIKKQLTVIDSLLRNTDFALAVAQAQDAAYYKGIGQEAPPFLPAAGDTATVHVSAAEEKTAINLAGFYALECAVGLLSTQQHEKPTILLEKIIANKIDTTSALLLKRFANATWKAGQPFRELEKIKRPVFMAAEFLPPEEIKKDYHQIQTAAIKLLSSMQEVKDSSLTGQMEKIRSLLHSKSYAQEMAAFTDSGYSTKQQQAAQAVVSSKYDATSIKKSVKDQKIATNVAGFYAVECGIGYLVHTRNTLPSAILQSIADDSIGKADKELFCRFANATWKAGQPFRGLNRIERETFTPFYFLSDADIEKDWVQIKTAAAMVLSKL